MTRICGRCSLTVERGRPDPCLGLLPGVRFACCGHGTDEGYIAFDNGVVVRSFVGLRVDGITEQLCGCDEYAGPHRHTNEAIRARAIRLDDIHEQRASA